MTSSNTSREAVYPDTDSLLKIAERVHAARTSVTNTAENMLGSADHVSNWAYHTLPLPIPVLTNCRYQPREVELNADQTPSPR